MDMFKPPPPMSFTTGNVAENWRRWEQQFITYFTAAELSKKDKKTKVAILLHCAGGEAQDIMRGFTFSGTEGDKRDVWMDVIKKFKEHCDPRKNSVFERHKFWQRDQKDSEGFDQWVTDLRILLDGCG